MRKDPSSRPRGSVDIEENRRATNDRTKRRGATNKTGEKRTKKERELREEEKSGRGARVSAEEKGPVSG